MTKSAHAQALIELALVLPVFLLLVMGILDLGRAAWQGNTIAEAAREGARYAATAPTDCDGITDAVENAAVGVTLSGPTPIVISEPLGPALGNPVTVTVTGSFTPVTPLIAGVIGQTSFTMTRASTMTIENGSAGPPC